MINWRDIAYLRIFKRLIYKKGAELYITGTDNVVTVIPATNLLAGPGQIANNTRLGANALDSTTSGQAIDNTAIGINSLTALSTGDDNTAVGNDSGLLLTTGSNNTLIGNEAGSALTTVNDVTAVGDQALKLSTGASNTAAGASTLSALTTGALNTAVGLNAGLVVTTGADNVFVGNNLSASAVGAVGQLVIGSDIACDQDNQITIGNSSGTIKNEFDTDATWTQASDVRKKTDIKTSELGLSFIMNLRPVTYQWKAPNLWPREWEENGIKSDGNYIDVDTDTVMTGFIAQEVKTALDKAGTSARFAGWSEGGDGMQRISKEMFVFPLVNAINELTARLEALEE
jgi:parallel beta-helix repeat protein